MFKRILILVLCCICFTGCEAIDTIKDNFSKITDQLDDSDEITSSSDEQKVPDDVKLPASILCSELAVNSKVSGVTFTTRQDSVTFTAMFEDKFSVTETIQFSLEENEEDSSEEQKIIVTVTDCLTLGKFKDLKQCLKVMDSSFGKLSFSGNKDGDEFIATTDKPVLLFDAPIDSLTACSRYCSQLYASISKMLDDAQAIKDGATGIVYHNVGGTEFNLVEYRLFVNRGGETRIEIANLPSGVNLTDISFISDKVAFATVGSDGVVKGINNGSATITVSIRGYAVYRTVYVQVI